MFLRQRISCKTIQYLTKLHLQNRYHFKDNVYLKKIKYLQCLVIVVVVVVNFSYFYLFLHNHWTNFNQTWNKAFFGKRDSSLFKLRARLFYIVTYSYIVYYSIFFVRVTRCCFYRRLLTFRFICRTTRPISDTPFTKLQ